MFASLRKLFTREGRMQATAERTEAEMRARIAEIESALSDGTVTASDLEEKESLSRELLAASIRSQTRIDAAYRARVTEEAAERRERMHRSLDKLGDLVPRLLLACSEFKGIAAEIQVKGLGYDAPSQMDQLLGVPYDFGEKVSAAIRAAAPDTEWDWGHTGPGDEGVKAERPKLRAPRSFSLIAGAGSPPPGYTGSWDYRYGPVETPL